MAEELEYLSFDEIKERENTLEDVTVYIKAWHGNVLIRPLLLADVQIITRNCTDPKTGRVDMDKQKALYLQKSLVKPELSFSQATELCSDQLKASASGQLWGAIDRINGDGGYSVEEADKSTE